MSQEIKISSAQSKLSKKIAVWIENQLISTSQGKAILDFEQNQKKNHFFSLMTVGFFSIACGVAALISSNWEYISDTTKLGGMFVILAGLTALLIQIYDKKPTLYEGLLFFYALFFFACIGLVGQIYHLVSDTYKAFLFWSFLTSPLLFVSRKNILINIWVPVFIGALFASPFGLDLIDNFFDLFGRSSLLVLSFMSFILYILLKFVRTERLISVSFFTSVGMIVPLILLETKYYLKSENLSSLALATILTVSAIFCTVVWTKTKLFLLEKKSVLSVVVVYVLTSFCGYLVYEDFALSFLTVCLLLALTFYAYAARNNRLFNVFIFALVLRILFDFFRAFGPLWATGIGLISTGAFLLIISYAFIRFKRFFEAQMKNEMEAKQ